MPGIVGLITDMPHSQAEEQLRNMLDSMCHESFYVHGTWSDERLGVYVGWLAHKGSFSEAMPLRNESGNLVLIFSGEEFPEPEIEESLKRKGHALDSNRASYLVHLAEEYEKFPAMLNGRFQGLLVDVTHATATLFNDRYGMQRVYCHEAQDAFYFSAEAKAILRVRPELRNLNAKALGEFVACGCVLENRTLFSGINILPAGSAWVFRGRALERKAYYFKPKEWEEQSLLDTESYFAELRRVFSKNLTRYFAGDQKLGMSLTGGLDTRMILAWHKPAAGSVPCYSFGSMFRDSQDVIVAREVAKASGQSHQVIPVGTEFLENFSEHAERTVYLTDGCLSVNHTPDHFVNQRAREIAPVRLTGNYGGEVLRRVRAFKPVQPSQGLFVQELLDEVEAATDTYATHRNTHPLTFAVFRQAPWHHYSLLSLEQTQLTLRSPFLDNDFVKTVFRAPASATTNNDVCLRLISEGDPNMLKIRTDRGFGGTRSGINAKLHQEYYEFTAKAEYAYDYGMPQWLAKIDRLLSPVHPERLFLGRHKFYHFRVWYRDFLANYLKEMLLDERSLSRPYIERRGLERIVNEHIKGSANHTTSIHKALSLELIQRLFTDTR
jgi:asparagine synthase (glutamine-hydrolysing)